MTNFLRYALFEQEAQCLPNDTLTVVLNLSVLIEKEGHMTEKPTVREPQTFTQYFNNDDFSDFTIFGRDGLVIHAHKVNNIRVKFSSISLSSRWFGKQSDYDPFSTPFQILLARCSPYFQSMLSSNMLESTTNSVKLEHDDPVALQKMIRFIYTQDIT